MESNKGFFLVAQVDLAFLGNWKKHSGGSTWGAFFGGVRGTKHLRSRVQLDVPPKNGST